MIHSVPSASCLVKLPGKYHDIPVDFDDTIEVLPVDTAIETTSRYNQSSNGTWETIHEHSEDEAIVRTSEASRFDLPHGAVMEWASETEAAVLANDPHYIACRAGNRCRD